MHAAHRRTSADRHSKAPARSSDRRWLPEPPCALSLTVGPPLEFAPTGKGSPLASQPTRGLQDTVPLPSQTPQSPAETAHAGKRSSPAAARLQRAQAIALPANPAEPWPDQVVQFRPVSSRSQTSEPSMRAASLFLPVPVLQASQAISKALQLESRGS